MSSQNSRNGLTTKAANRCVGSAAPRVMENQQYRTPSLNPTIIKADSSENFFFFRGAGDRSILDGLVPTLSHQLYHRVPATIDSIENAIDTDPLITTKSSTYQFQKLIIEPIRAASNAIPSFPALIILIDALDECDDKLLMREFVEGVIRTFQENHGLPLQVIITSRVDEHIQEALETPAAFSVVRRLSLPDFDARADIRAFFESGLCTLYSQKRRLMRDVSPPWPSKSDINSLVDKSGGSFLLAASLIDFIGSRGLPQDNLRSVLTAEDLWAGTNNIPVPSIRHVETAEGSWAGTSSTPGPPIRHLDAVKDEESKPRGCTGAGWTLWALRKVYMCIGQIFSGRSRVWKITPYLPWPASCPPSTRRLFPSTSCIMSLIHRLYLFILLYMPWRYAMQAGRLFDTMLLYFIHRIPHWGSALPA